ncbi:hypothetical protein RFI_29663 [Reticulomyxa filosa]|uniref:Uncharacterized protein n=1 Tax=Reticulomyxa filosa TaxID=46433 RepID=X6M1F8_RETFI|nr:hypothetical protein RFI_29663 [Reticulomyxa filosa]|eukprot:ETO07724.1 hypothetical protein RFI_29663 [Reticulomyxa filosa]
MQYGPDILPHSPYGNVSGGVIHVWRPKHWASWMFIIDEKTSTNTTFQFEKGGFQDARGNNNGQEFYVENLFEELDMETEWYFNTSTRILYYYNNKTGPPLPSDDMEACNLKVLISLIGNMSNPVSNVTIRGIVLENTQYTYLDPHGMPSGGDWALQRTGAIYLDGTWNVSISNNEMTRLDGIAISVNRYNRLTVIARNEIAWTGDSAITLWGDTNGITFPSSMDTSTMGWDGTDGNQPRGVQIIQNYVHELGIWEKQSSFLFQGKSCQNVIAYNIFYNGPRAGINFNDGFGGGSLIFKNLLFNTCRESGDHGLHLFFFILFFLFRNYFFCYDEISFNFVIANYNSQEAVDNDDGSCYFWTHHNFFVYASNGLKGDYGGHDNRHAQYPGYNDAYFNNTVVLRVDLDEYGIFSCGSEMSAWPILGNNVISSPSGNTSEIGLCDLPLKQFQTEYNYDLGSIVENWPSDEQLLSGATQLLFS